MTQQARSLLPAAPDRYPERLASLVRPEFRVPVYRPDIDGLLRPVRPRGRLVPSPRALTEDNRRVRRLVAELEDQVAVLLGRLRQVARNGDLDSASVLELPHQDGQREEEHT